MKLLLVLSVVLFGIWLWRSNREANPKHDRKSPETKTPTLDMVRCTLCSIHIPKMDAVQGKTGTYCSPEHLHRAEP